jgi:uncharacterized protein YhdP
LVGEVRVANMHRFLSDFNFPSKLGESNGQVYFNLNWENQLIPSANTLKGRVVFNIANGVVSSTNNPLESLLKLISLDLGNLFGKDYSFSRLFGELKLDGDMLEILHAKIKLQPATLGFQGTVKRAQMHANLILEVTPKITNSIVGLALSPILFLMTELNIKKSWINRAFSHQYVAEGPIEKLKIKFYKMGRIGTQSP